jgi:K+-transporting ATPase ATPase C chain
MKLLRPALGLSLFFLIFAGAAFPLAVTALAQAAFPHQANGSLLRDARGKAIGSELVGQSFASPAYFHPRPSAAGDGYDASSSSGTNLGPTSAKLLEGDEEFAGVRRLAQAYRLENRLSGNTPIPVDAVTRSASGLDPHISLRNAELQVPRVARARGISEGSLRQLVRAAAESTPDFPGEPIVNVLLINATLDRRD